MKNTLLALAIIAIGLVGPSLIENAFAINRWFIVPLAYPIMMFCLFRYVWMTPKSKPCNEEAKSK